MNRDIKAWLTRGQRRLVTHDATLHNGYIR
jgi:hypothetical protein